jgi:hypothetical protein
MTSCIDSVLKNCAANRKRRLSALINVGPYIYIYIYTTLKFLALQGAPYIYYIYDISRLRVKGKATETYHGKFKADTTSQLRNGNASSIKCPAPYFYILGCFTESIKSTSE